MNNDRGIFILTVFKKILDKLLYFDLKEDLEDFGIDGDLVMLQQMSKGTTKRLVKAKARKYAFNELMKSIDKKEGHSKLKNINYTELKMQDYMKDGNTKIEEAINIFKF